MPLPFEPASLPLLLGSMPHTDARQAFDMVRKYTSALLAWPQLPQRSFREHSVVQSALGFPGLVVDVEHQRVYVEHARAERELDRLSLAYLENRITFAALPDDYAQGLAEVLERGYDFSSAQALKGQTLGPISLAAQLTDEHHRPLIYDDKLFDAVVQHVRLRATWQEARLGELTGATIVCLDEPFLSIVDEPFLPFDWQEVRTRLDEAFGGLVGCRALFAGGPFAWAEAFATAAELVIGDVYAHGDGLVADAQALNAFLERDGMIGLGIVPVDAQALEQLPAEALLDRVQALLDQLAAAGVAPERLLRQAVITPAAGLGHVTVEQAEVVLQRLQQLSMLLRDAYQLTDTVLADQQQTSS